MSQNKPLEPRQEAFCQHYIANGFNATKAAISAGYSEKTARSQGQRLLTNVDIRARIEELGGKIAEETGKTAQDVVNLVTNIAFFDVRKVLTVKGNSVVFSVADFNDLPEEVAVLIQSIEEKITKFGTTIKVTFVDKIKAIDMLNRYHSLYKDKLELSSDLTESERRERILQLQAKIRENTKPDAD